MRCFFSCIKILYHEKVVTPFSTFQSTYTDEAWRKRNRSIDNSNNISSSNNSVIEPQVVWSLLFTLFIPVFVLVYLCLVVCTAFSLNVRLEQKQFIVITQSVQHQMPNWMDYIRKYRHFWSSGMTRGWRLHALFHSFEHFDHLMILMHWLCNVTSVCMFFSWFLFPLLLIVSVFVVWWSFRFIRYNSYFLL